MLFAFCTAYYAKIYGEWEELINRFTDDLDELMFTPYCKPEVPQGTTDTELLGAEISEGDAKKNATLAA